MQSCLSFPAALDLQFNSVLLFQFQEDEVWNDIDEIKIAGDFGLEKDIYTYAKQRAIETIDRLLETKKNHLGYAVIHHQLYKV